VTLIRISPDGSEVVYVHNDVIHSNVTSKHSDVEIQRATDVYYDNEEKMWKVRILAEPFNEVLPVKFYTRQQAIDYEVLWLEKLLREHKY
jgi:hypothetical protein